MPGAGCGAGCKVVVMCLPGDYLCCLAAVGSIGGNFEAGMQTFSQRCCEEISRYEWVVSLVQHGVLLEGRLDVV